MNQAASIFHQYTVKLPPWEGHEGDSSERHRCHPCPQDAYRLGEKINFKQITSPKDISIQVEVEGEEAIKQVKERKVGRSRRNIMHDF